MHPRHCDILRLLKSLQQKKNRFKLYSTEWIWININDACMDYSMFHGSPAVTSRRCPEGRTHLWGRLPTRPTSPRRSRLGWPQCSSKSSTHRCSTLQPRPKHIRAHTLLLTPCCPELWHVYFPVRLAASHLCVSSVSCVYYPYNYFLCHHAVDIRLILLLCLGFVGAADWITRVNDSSCFSLFFFFFFNENITSAIPSLHRAVSFSVDRAIQFEG